MKKLGKLILSLILVCCCAVSFAACFDDETEKFSKPSGFKFDETTVTVSFNAVDGAESYNAKVTAADKTAVYENESLKVTKIELKDKKLAAGEYTVTVKVNAVSGKEASDEATYKFSITKTALAAPADLTKEGDNVTWTAVEGATNGYSVRIYNKETNIEVLPATTVTVAAFSTETANELVNAQTETLTYVIEVKAIATDNNLESAVATIEWVVKGKILKPTLETAATADGTSVTWTADTRATAGYKAQLYKGTDLVKEYDIAAGTAAFEINRTDALKGQEYTLKVYGVATDDLRQGDVAEIKFTQSLPAIGEVENLAVNGMVATWDAVEGATAGYSVTVYRKGNEENIKLDAELVAQADAPSIDLSALAYAAEKDYVVSVVVNAVDGEYAASAPVTAEYKSGSIWTFADAEDKVAFVSHGPSVEIVEGKLLLSEPKSGANVVRFNHHFNVGDRITINMKTKRLWIYGNSRTDNAAHVVKAFAIDGNVPDQVGWDGDEEKEQTLVLVVMKEIEGLFMDMDAGRNLSVTINSLKIEAGNNTFGSYMFYSGTGANAELTQNGTLKMASTAGSGKLVTVAMPVIKAGSVIEVTYGAVTATEGNNNNFFVYGINGNYDTLIINDKTVLRRNGYTNDINTETVGGNKVESYVVDYDIYGLRYDFGAVGTSVEIKGIRVIEVKSVYDFTNEDDAKWFAVDSRIAEEKQMSISVVDNDNTKALNVKSVKGSNMLVFSYQLKAGSKITIDIKSKACFVYGKGASDNTNFTLDMDAIAETEITGDGSRHTVTLDVNKDCVGIYLMFNDAANTDADGSFIYSITITPPQA